MLNTSHKNHRFLIHKYSIYYGHKIFPKMQLYEITLDVKTTTFKKTDRVIWK